MIQQIGIFNNIYEEDENNLRLAHYIIVIMAIVLNCTLIILVLIGRKLRSVVGIFYVFNLSLANIIFSAFVLSSGFFKENNDNLSICNLITATTTFSCVAASFSRCIIAIDRYLYISDPLHYYTRWPESRVACIILFLWVTAASITFPPYATAVHRSNKTMDKSCLPEPRYIHQYAVGFLGVTLPMICKIFVYSRIFYWAVLHIQIMKQEAVYCNQLRERSVKESYNVNIQQLELFTRASLLMASAIFAIKATESKVDVHQDSSLIENPHTPKSDVLKQFTLRNYIGSLFPYNNSDKNSAKIDLPCITPFVIKPVEIAYSRSSISPIDIRPELINPIDKNSSLTSQETIEIKHPEDIWVEEELRQLSKKVENKEVKVSSLALTNAITKLLTCTELKAGCVLFIILGTSVFFWAPFLNITILQLFEQCLGNCVLSRKLSNLCIYSLSCVDPIVYDILHQPIRTAIKEELKISIVNKEY